MSLRLVFAHLVIFLAGAIFLSYDQLLDLHTWAQGVRAWLTWAAPAFVLLLATAGLVARHRTMLAQDLAAFCPALWSIWGRITWIISTSCLQLVALGAWLTYEALIFLLLIVSHVDGRDITERLREAQEILATGAGWDRR